METEDTESAEKSVKVTTIRLPTELADWIDENFPHGFKQTFVLQCFLSLRHVMTEGELPPHSEYARAASIDAMSTLAKPREP